MFKMYFLPIIVSFVFGTCNAQTETETAPPFNIKTISFVQNSQNIAPIFQLGDSFQLQFDDLFGNEANYYYTLTLCDYDWKPSELSKNEYLQGFDDQRIQDYTNSFNTLQIYSHYNLPFPNKFTQFKVSGNYMLKILNEDKEVVFSKKFILYENLATVPIQVRRARNGLDLSTKQDLDFSVKSTFISFQNPTKNVKVLLIQNGQLQNAISNVVPQYTIGNDLIYKYDTQTQFWAGNEFLYFDTKDIRVPANYVSYVDSNSGIYNSHLFGNNARSKYPYTYYPDVNGNFVIRRLNAENQDIEADYSWVFFTLTAPSYFGKDDIYINGMFNNFCLTADNKMDYNAQKGIYEKAIMIKQGFTNYQYVIANKSGKIDSEQAIDGNYYQTENNYSILVYYRENGQRNDRIIGKGDASSENIIN
jgi:hypothetical protein